MAEVTGVVEQVKITTGNWGDMVSYKINGKFYDNGKFPVRGIKEGDFVKVKFTTNEKGYHKIDKGGLIKIEGTPQASPVEAVPSSKPPAQYYDARQDVISKQAAFNTALALLDLQIKLGGVKFAANAKAPDIFTTFNNIVNTEAARIYQLNTGKVWDIDTAPFDDAVPTAKSPADSPDKGFDEYPD